ncbi:unnamed protein product [Miscanthus lutarioriparius]|uniref:Helicase and polymerase-containing protein TEBICHI n=1 Tax=Miscanthus lutarioriparius TaxID=422564 RepID=A0A811STM9_9POAL|nr:unnamed protein product [Miscanthus lutarioriparius]
MASGSSGPQIDQFFPAKKRRPSSRKDESPRPGTQHESPGGAKGSLEEYLVRSPSTRAAAAASAVPVGSPSGGDPGTRRSLSAAMDVDVGSSAPVVAVVGGEADFDLRRSTADFLSHSCSAILPLRGDCDYSEQWGMKQKRSATQSFLVPCDNDYAKKQRVAHCGGLEALKELDDNVASVKQCINHHGGSEAMEEPFEGEQVSCVGFSALQRCSFTPSTAQRKVGFSLAPVETLKSVSRNSLTSPGEEFWNAAIELADGISAQADKVCGRPEFDAAEDKSSCAVAVCSKTLCRSGRDELDCQNTVGSNDTHHMEKLSNKVESLAVHSQHIINSPLPVKQLDFFHEDDIKVSCSKFEAKGSYEACNAQADHVPLKDSGLLGKENLKDPVDVMKKSANNLHTDSAAMRCQGVFKSTIEGKVHPTQEGERDSHLIRRDLNQPTHNENKSLAAYSNNCKTWIDSKSKFASEEVEASTPTSSIPLKDHSKLSSWLPPELCAMYMKKGISELYPWQVECLLVEGVLDKRNLVYCASTSAGKSFVAEVLMLRRILSSGNMAILVLPYVSICAEKAEHLEQLLEPLGRHVRSFYGNQGGGSLPKDTAVAVCTIEKANSLVNKLLEDGRLSELGIIVIDELHMVGDQHRGYLLELMLTKLRYAAGEGTLQSSSGEISGSSSGKMASHGLQIIGMSATMPNIAAVADWLQAALYQTDFRPVPLEEFIKVGNQIFDKDMNVVRVLPKVADIGGKDPDHIVELCNEVVLQGHSVLLFCSSRKGCESTARHVAKFLKLPSAGSSDVSSEFSDAAAAIEALRRCPAGLDPILGETLPFGVAYHHAGLTVEEREIVESCYRKGLVRVLTATSTLAAGVNLPARRVIFRQPKIGRDFIDGTRYRQMAGRAGRTGIDTKGESILVCRLEEVKRITGIIRSNCPPLESCLSEDKNGMTHAIMEVVAGGIVQTANDIHRYVRCTLLNSTRPFDDVVKSAQDSLRWLCHKRFLDWNHETKIYSATPLGRAAFGSSLNPEESLVVLDDLSRAREGFVLASDLHLVYLVTPINVGLEPDWELYYERFMQLASLEQSVGNRVGVIEPFLMHMAHGASMPVCGRPQRNTGLSNKSAQAGGNALVSEHTLRVSKRFYVALMLSRLAQEIPIADVCETFKVARGMIQALQENAGRFASMVSAFCQRLGWNDLEGLVSKFQNRVSFGVRAEIAELTSIPFVKGSRARALYKSGLRTPVAIAEASIPEIAKALFESSGWSGQDSGLLDLMQFGIAKKIKNGARKIVLEEAEAARVAAFSAFKSLGVEVPQFTAPPLAAIEDYPTRDTIDQAKSNKLAFGTHARDDKNKNNCSDYATPRASTYSLRKDLNPAPSIQMKENAELSKNVKITRQGAAASLSTEIADGLSSRDVADKGPVHAYNFPGVLTVFLINVFGLAVCWENSPIYYCNFPKDLVTTGNNDFREMWGYFQRRWEKITDIMQQKSVQKMTWNLKIQIQALKSPYISCQRLERFHLDHKMLDKVEVLDNSYMLLSPISVYNGLDICLLAWVLWPDEESRTVPNLEKFVKRRLHSEAAAAANRDGRWRNQMHKAAHNGCCRRAAQTRALYTVLKKLLTQNLSDLVETIEAPLVNVLADMELWGIGADMDACLHILYTHLKLPVPKGCEKGKLHPSTDKQSLDHLRDQHPIIPVIKEHRTLAKLLNGTLWSICSRAQLCTQSQRYIIHGNWLQTSTATGRLSMEEPNLQCVEHLVEFDTGKSDKDYSSVSVDYHHKINARDFFIPTKENWLFVTADYSQIELRLMAHFSKDPTLVELLSKPDVPFSVCPLILLTWFPLSAPSFFYAVDWQVQRLYFLSALGTICQSLVALPFGSSSLVAGGGAAPRKVGEWESSSTTALWLAPCAKLKLDFGLFNFTFVDDGGLAVATSEGALDAGGSQRLADATLMRDVGGGSHAAASSGFASEAPEAPVAAAEYGKTMRDARGITGVAITGGRAIIDHAPEVVIVAAALCASRLETDLLFFPRSTS